MNQQMSIDPRACRPNPWNSNVVSPDNEAKLDEAIRRMGFFKPIICREIEEDGETVLQIIGGEHRRDAAIRIGLEEIPVYNLGPIDDVEAKRISLADNARYGSDDTFQLAQILEDIGQNDVHEFLPFTETDLEEIFSSVDIALDDLEIDEDDTSPSNTPVEKEKRAPKTHQLMRFKVANADAERLTQAITRIQKKHGYTTSDELTNAGDALVHLVLGSESEA